MAESLNDDPVYVAVSKDFGESRLTLLWALRHLRLKKLYLVHVHQQIPMNPTSSGLEQSEIDAIQELELSSSFENLDKYHDTCQEEGVIGEDVDILWTLANNVGEGIVELIYENNIKKLIMGAAAADSNYSEGMANFTSSKAKYVSHHAPHSCKIWLVCNGELIQTREGRFDLAGSSHSSSESLSRLHNLNSALVPHEEAVSAEHDTESHALSLSGDQSVLYNEEVSRRIEAEEELNRAKAEIEEMKRVQMELEEQLYIDCPFLLDEAISANEELLRRLNLERDESSSHSPSSPSHSSLPNEPPPHFICPITQAVMRNPHVAADGYTYEAEAFRSWLSHGGQNSPMTNLRLGNQNLTPNLVLRSAINEWLEQNPHFSE